MVGTDHDALSSIKLVVFNALIEHGFFCAAFAALSFSLNFFAKSLFSSGFLKSTDSNGSANSSFVSCWILVSDALMAEKESAAPAATPKISALFFVLFILVSFLVKI